MTKAQNRNLKIQYSVSIDLNLNQKCNNGSKTTRNSTSSVVKQKSALQVWSVTSYKQS